MAIIGHPREWACVVYPIKKLHTNFYLRAFGQSSNDRTSELETNKAKQFQFWSSLESSPIPEEIRGTAVTPCELRPRKLGLAPGLISWVNRCLLQKKGPPSHCCT
ncbi:hypothetical protein CDAR_471161 [Caerostris darwini]|uniref:Uncharacterized protein n=1 Tax=Caerostris darwini TaxID=1538125 RepID=A0AAV4QM12_9ARAC|nr:hypothetical protein CDAR_471161 [Caerostris darwini]